MIDFIINMTFADWLGIAGSILICLGYLAVSNRWVESDSARFHWLNLTGAGLLLVSLGFRPNYGAILIETIWAAIAVYSLIRLFIKSNNPKTD